MSGPLNDKLLDEAVNKTLNEKSYETNKSFIAGMSLSQFSDFIHSDQMSDLNDKALYDEMLLDATVRNVIDAYVAEIVIRDTNTNHICTVLSEDAKLVEELNSFLFDNINIDALANNIVLRMLAYGCAPCELAYIDSTTDSQWQLFSESEKLKDMTSENLLESLSKKDVKEFLVEGKKLRVVSNKKALKEDVLELRKKQFPVRWYLNQLPIWSLKVLNSKGKDIAYLDPTVTDRVYDGRTLVPFMNISSNDSTSISSTDGSDSYTISASESFLKPARKAYRVLSSFEDLLLIHALTTSINYRIFSVEVGNLDEKQTPALLGDIKKRINENESFNLETSFYNASMTGVPLGASILIPTRNGVGTISVQQIDNSFGTSELGDFNYFKNKLATALHSNSLLTGSTDNAGGLDSGGSMSVLDDRASQYIELYRNIFASGIESLCDYYLRLTRTESAYSKLTTFSIRLARNIDAEQVNFLKGQSEAASSLQQVVRALKDLGLDMKNFSDTQLLLVRKFLGNEIADSLALEMESASSLSSRKPPIVGDDSTGGELGSTGDDSFDSFEVSDEEVDNAVSGSDEEQLTVEEPGIEL
jgi:hypothetical protein|nr:MAG TPA: capsid assembly protein [Caudoviricetes sp.]